MSPRINSLKKRTAGMATSTSLLVALAVVSPAKTFADDAMLIATPGSKVETAIGYSANRQCELVVTESCKPRNSTLGTISVRMAKIDTPAMSSIPMAKCANPATGAFAGTGMGAEAVTAIVFTAGNTYGYEQITVTCTKSDDSTEQHYLKFGVLKDSDG